MTFCYTFGVREQLGTAANIILTTHRDLDNFGLQQVTIDQVSMLIRLPLCHNSGCPFQHDTRSYSHVIPQKGYNYLSCPRMWRQQLKYAKESILREAMRYPRLVEVTSARWLDHIGSNSSKTSISPTQNVAQLPSATKSATWPCSF